MTGAAQVLSVVDTRSGVLHLVAVEMFALHRRFGRYPALCDDDVITASLTTSPTGECQDCAARAQPGAGAVPPPELRHPRRLGLSWRGRARRVRPDALTRKRRRGEGN